MRHAKAEPFGDKGDSERELTDKGLKQAKAVGKGIESLGLVPDQISCSSVTRTRQTLDRMLKTFGDKPIVDYRISLYAVSYTHLGAGAGVTVPGLAYLVHCVVVPRK